MKILEILEFNGHKNLKATHKTTLEITKENFLTERGDCIIGINSNKAAKDIRNTLSKSSKIKVFIIVDNLIDFFDCYYSEKLFPTSETSLVFRKSDFVDSRTVGIKCNKAAKDIKREIVIKLRNGKKGKLIICGEVV